MSDNPEQPAAEAELQAAHEPEPTADPTEPKLSTLIRFEAGEVGDLLAHVKEWVEWRLAGGAKSSSDVTTL